MSERDQLLYRLGESPATAEKTRISEQIEALDAADARKLQPPRLDYRDQPYTSVTRDRTGKVAVEATAWGSPGGGNFTNAEIEKLFGPGGNPPSKEAIDQQYRERLASLKAGALQRAREREAEDAARADFDRGLSGRLQWRRLAVNLLADVIQDFVRVQSRLVHVLQCGGNDLQSGFDCRNLVHNDALWSSRGGDLVPSTDRNSSPGLSVLI